VAGFIVEEGVSLEMAIGGQPDHWQISPVSGIRFRASNII